jgi:hypothetical protein
MVAAVSTDAWFREFEREEAKRMERIDIIKGEMEKWCVLCGHRQDDCDEWQCPYLVRHDG